MKIVSLTTDGACLGNPGPGGWAALLRFGEHDKVVSGGETETTNNRMELTAIIEGLRLLKEPCQVQIVTDSRYVMDAFEQGWLRSWTANNWRTSANKEVKNQDLWQALLAETKRHRISWTWVKGHSGHPDNELVDKAARKAAESFAT